MKEIFFHEDDYRQIELLPLDNLEFCLQQTDAIDAFGNEHRTGDGWDAMHIRTENPTPLSGLRIGLDAVRQSLAATSFEYDTVTTGYGAWRQACPHIHAFGTTDGHTLFAQAEDGILVAVWCSDVSLKWQQLPLSEGLLFVDWGWSFVSPLRDTPRLLAYLQERVARGLLVSVT